VKKSPKNAEKGKENREKREKWPKSAQYRAKWVVQAIFERFPALLVQKGLQIHNFFFIILSNIFSFSSSKMGTPPPFA
jgi:hypothetical protein